MIHAGSLLSTGDSRIVYAGTDCDTHLGVGYLPGTALVNRLCWGTNTIGTALMNVRRLLRGYPGSGPCGLVGWSLGLMDEVKEFSTGNEMMRLKPWLRRDADWEDDSMWTKFLPHSRLVR